MIVPLPLRCIFVYIISIPFFSVLEPKIIFFIITCIPNKMW